MKLPPSLGEVLARVQGERRNTLRHSISVLPRTWLASWKGSKRKTAATSSTSVFSKRWAGVNLLPFFVSAPLEVILCEFRAHGSNVSIMLSYTHSLRTWHIRPHIVSSVYYLPFPSCFCQFLCIGQSLVCVENVHDAFGCHAHDVAECPRSHVPSQSLVGFVYDYRAKLEHLRGRQGCS